MAIFNSKLFDWLIKELQEGKRLISYGAIRSFGYGLDFVVPILLATRFSPKFSASIRFP